MSGAMMQRLDPMEARRRTQRKALVVVSAIGLVVLIFQFFPTAARSVQAGDTEIREATQVAAKPVPHVWRKPVAVTWPMSIARDPFARSAVKPVAVSNQPADRGRSVKPDLGGLDIGAIVVAVVPQAVVADVVCREGDVVRGFTVVEIAAEGILVEKAGMRYRLVP